MGLLINEITLSESLARHHSIQTNLNALTHLK